MANAIEFRSIATATTETAPASTVEFVSLSWLLELAEEVVSEQEES
jgi:hypothetical protein